MTAKMVSIPATYEELGDKDSPRRKAMKEMFERAWSGNRQFTYQEFWSAMVKIATAEEEKSSMYSYKLITGSPREVLDAFRQELIEILSVKLKTNHNEQKRTRLIKDQKNLSGQAYALSEFKTLLEELKFRS